MSNLFFFASDFYKYECSSLVHKVKTTTIHLKTFKGSQGHCYLAGNFKSQKKNTILVCIIYHSNSQFKAVIIYAKIKGQNQ